MKDPDKFLFVLQAVSAAVQILASFFIGEIAKLVGSIKWVIITLYLLSFAGNFLYSCGGAVSSGTLLGGRIICGAASASGAIIFSYITSVTKERVIVFKLVAMFRTAAGIFMALSQVVAILCGLLDFKVQGYRITSYNAPTFASGFIILAVCLLLIFNLENPKVKSKRLKNSSFFGAVKQFFGMKRQRLLSCLILLWNMFLSSFIMSEVVYFMPIFLTLNIGWDTKFQGVAFMVASILGVAGSYFAPKLKNIKILSRKKNEAKMDNSDSNGTEKPERNESEGAKEDSLYVKQVNFTIFALLLLLIGQAIMIGASEASTHNSLHPTNAGIFFVTGLTIAMLGYNFMASSVPALFSMSIDANLKLRLMPSIGAISGVGKLVAPIVLAALYKTELGLPIAVGFGMMLVSVSMPTLFWIRVKRY